MGVFMVIGIIVLVLLTNWDTIRRKFGRPAPAPVVASDPEAEGGQIGDDLSGFMQDESFFDKGSSTFQSDVNIETGTKVNVMMDSIGQDLRIMVIDAMGHLVTGQEFAADVEGVGIYTDDDRDGIIYVEHLREGDYFVKLAEIEGYIVPRTKTMIKISKDLEFKALSDIAFLVLTEDQVDVKIEDTENRSAQYEGDGSENIDADAYKDVGKLGIDVSGHNGEIDWEAVKDAGIDFAIVRCGYRGASSGSLILDSYFKENMRGAIKAGIPVGVYFFSQAVNETEAIEEASMVVEECKLYMLDLPIFIDSESAGGSGRADDLDVEKRTAITRAFCETITNSGYEAGVYASKNWWNKKIDAEQLTLYHAWLAQYTEEPDYEGYYDYWQYTSKGTIDGIEGRVDLNIRYR